MDIATLPIPEFVKQKYPYPSLTPVQEKAVNAGLLKEQPLLICAPTASGKTFVATLAITSVLGKGKALYVVPLKALAAEKYKEYKLLLEGTGYKTILSTGEVDSDAHHLANYDIIILTTEKLDSVLRYHVPWLNEVKVVIIDEIHLLNDPGRGPVLEIIITQLKMLLKPQIIGLSATIGNPQEIADWLEAKLVQDSWRPVELKQGIYCNDKIEFY